MNSFITESGMDFVANNSFHIEKSPSYTRLGNSIKSVEFIRAKDDKLIFIEAKSSFPNPNKPMPHFDKGVTTGAEQFRIEIAAICDKFIHSLHLYAAVAIGATEDGFPSNYNPPDKVSILFVLVINGFEKSWCDEIERALTNLLRESICMAKIWKPKVFVMNDKIAAIRGLTTRK